MFGIFSGLLSSVKNTGKWITFEKKKPIKVVMIGLDDAGKTTILYRLGKESEISTAMNLPTIGFNVENLESSKSNIICWDVGGCARIRSLWRHYLDNIDAIIVVIDSNDRDRFNDLVHEMNSVLDSYSYPVLILANKQDLPNAMSVNEISQKMASENILKGKEWNIISTCATTGDGLADIVPMLEHLLKRAADDKDVPSNHSHEDEIPVESPSASSVIPISIQADIPVKRSEKDAAVDTAVAEHMVRVLQTTWNDWTARTLHPATDDEFITALTEYSLDLWDHYTHVRAAYILLSRYGWEEGCQRTNDSLQSFILNSERTASVAAGGGKGRSFHFTMTRFWCSMIYFWMERFRINASDHEVEQENNFPLFLRYIEANRDGETDIADKTLFRQYYSSPVMFAAEAKLSYVPPDLKSLPAM